MDKNRLKNSIIVFLIVVISLSFVQIKVERAMILLERFIPYGGWIEIFFIGIYAGVVIYNMQDASKVSKWRKYTWALFSFVFFGQIFLGIIGYEKFLMVAGKLHLPVPAVILGGPIYRMQLGFMTFLFLSTIIISGPTWCSHFCYFGALDNLSSSRKKGKKGIIKNKTAFKYTFFALVVFGALLMKIIGVTTKTAAIVGGSFGIVGILIIIFISSRKGKMIHCTTYCPIGTIVNHLKFINPFRMYIDDSSCTSCGVCTTHCKYDALNIKDIKNRKPAISCTLCGDCISSCHSGSIKYKFFNLSPEKSRNLYLIITISLHAMFLALARL